MQQEIKCIGYLLIQGGIKSQPNKKANGMIQNATPKELESTQMFPGDGKILHHTTTKGMWETSQG